MDYKESNLYKQGLFHQEFAKLLLDENTTINDIAEFGHKYGTILSVGLEQNTPKKKRGKK